MLYFWILDYTPQVIYWVYTGSLRNCFWVLRSYLGKINIKRSFSVAVTWVVYLSLAQAPGCTEILLSGFSIWLCLQRQKKEIPLLLTYRVKSLVWDCVWRNPGTEGFLVGFHTFLQRRWIAPLPPSFVQITLRSVVFLNISDHLSSPPPPPHYYQPRQSVSECKQSGILKDISSN